MLIGFYEIRKLAEAKKLSSRNMGSRHRVVSHRSLGKPVHKLNRHKYWELYDLNGGTEHDVDLLFLCNQFVHSYVFIASFNEARQFDGVLVSSDRKRLHEVYLVPLQKIVEIFEMVGADYPSRITARYNSKIQDYDFT